jgi:NAD/NADP transhydrogenase alpha subunit
VTVGPGERPVDVALIGTGMWATQIAAAARRAGRVVSG